MCPVNWKQHYNSPTLAFGLAGPLKYNPSGYLEETFPTKALGIRYNYLVAPQNHIDITKYQSITYTIGVTVLSGTPTFEYLSPSNQCKVACNPVSARLMIWTKNVSLSDTTNRWWSNPVAIPLAPGKFSQTVSLDPINWTGVLGQKAPLNFDKDVVGLTITFGGGWFYGHGTDTANGKASFQLYNYTLQ
jgi:hypothetical protein